MKIKRVVTLGENIYKEIDQNKYLLELYENILYNYSIKTFGISNESDMAGKPVDIDDALRFADLLSKSTSKKNADKHKIWAQEIVALLNFMYPQNNTIKYYLGSVLSCTGNYHGMSMITPKYKSATLLERIYSNFDMDYMRIPAEPENYFFRSQKDVYDHLKDDYFSYSGPTSMGKSYIMRMFIKQQIMNGTKMNFALLVPTKALINEVSSKTINDLKDMLVQHNYRIVTSSGALVLKQSHNFIFVLTPERLLYLMISNPQIQIDYLFVDEAHKISSKDARSAFYYKVVDLLAQRKHHTRIIFSSPNIPNPEVYLKLIPSVENSEGNMLATSFAPVSQVKFLIDFVEERVQVYDSYNKKFILVGDFEDVPSFYEVIDIIGGDSQNIIYCSSTAQAIEYALQYSAGKTDKDNNELNTLSRDIKNEVHGDYYLAKIITKGVAYHIGYLPSAIRMRIEDLYRQGLINTMFCTSTLVEGVNLPADNLFITNYKNGRSNMTPVDFKNLIGRVGRIEYNLYGNVFLVRLADKVKKEQFEKLLTEDVPEQKLSIASELTANQKKIVVQCLLDGNIELLKHPSNQSADSYSLMRKFAIILLKDISSDRNSLVREEFEPFLKEGDAEKIKLAFDQGEVKQDDDINVSVDQMNNLKTAIVGGLQYPTITNGKVSYSELMDFLEKLCTIFKWEKYESQTLGKKSRNGNHAMLRWYAVILAQWIQGTGLSYIMSKAIEYKDNNPDSKIMVNGKLISFENTLKHRNVVISETLGVIENIILFKFSNYFLRFSTEYKQFHKVDTIQNDWYEYVEYGTTNTLTILLQRIGFSRETSTYIKTHRNEYVVEQLNGELALLRSILECSNTGVRREALEIQYNMPEMFVHSNE